MLLFLHQRATKEDGRKLSLFVHARGVVGMSYSQLPYLGALYSLERVIPAQSSDKQRAVFKMAAEECFLVSEFGILLYMPICFIFKDFQFIFYSQPGWTLVIGISLLIRFPCPLISRNCPCSFHTTVFQVPMPSCMLLSACLGFLPLLGLCSIPPTAPKIASHLS